MTNEFAQPFLRLPPSRYHFTRFGTLGEYTKFLGSLDIGLAPLLPTEYNRCRSDVKFLEYAAHGVPGIYADLEPYRETVVPGQTGLLYRTQEEFFQALNLLAGDALLRRRIRENAHTYVDKHRLLSDRVSERLDFYRSLLPIPPRGAELPAEVVAAATRDGNYLQLRPQAPERTLVELIQAPASAEGAQRLARVVEEHPNWQPALQELGRMYNDLRDHRQALGFLQRALVGNAYSARTHAEVGRSYFMLNNPGEALRYLEKCLELNSLYYPGWQYLLRLLALTKSPVGRLWAERALEVHPRNFALALLGARLYPGAEVVAVLDRLLDRFAPTLSAEERPQAAVAFSQAIMELAGPLLGAPSAADLLRRACEVFPHSARLADMLGYALFIAGQPEESRRHFHRALEIRRTAGVYHAEFPKEDGRVHFWQFAENIQRALAEQETK
jgi:tetratricopeptide (TPR) repeat protein